METLGDRIKQIRKFLKLNQDDFAKKIGIESAVAVSNYEKNQRTPDINKLLIISKLGKISLDELVTGNKIEYKETQDQFNSTHIIKEGTEDYPEIKISEALRMCSAVLESKTSYAVALYHNLMHFDRAVKNESLYNKCYDDLVSVNKSLSEMRSRMDEVEKVNKKLKDEIKKLQGQSGGSAPIALSMDHAAPTGTEDKEI